MVNNHIYQAIFTAASGYETIISILETSPVVSEKLFAIKLLSVIDYTADDEYISSLFTIGIVRSIIKVIETVQRAEQIKFSIYVLVNLSKIIPNLIFQSGGIDVLLNLIVRFNKELKNLLKPLIKLSENNYIKPKIYKTLFSLLLNILVDQYKKLENNQTGVKEPEEINEEEQEENQDDFYEEGDGTNDRATKSESENQLENCLKIFSNILTIEQAAIEFEKSGGLKTVIQIYTNKESTQEQLESSLELISVVGFPTEEIQGEFLALNGVDMTLKFFAFNDIKLIKYSLDIISSLDTNGMMVVSNRKGIKLLLLLLDNYQQYDVAFMCKILLTLTKLCLHEIAAKEIIKSGFQYFIEFLNSIDESIQLKTLELIKAILALPRNYYKKKIISTDFSKSINQLLLSTNRLVRNKALDIIEILVKSSNIFLSLLAENNLIQNINRIYEIEKFEVLTDLLTNIGNDNKLAIEIMETGLLKSLLRHIRSLNYKVLNSILDCLYNLIKNNLTIIYYISNSNSIHYLIRLLENLIKKVSKTTDLIISVVTKTLNILNYLLISLPNRIFINENYPQLIPILNNIRSQSSSTLKSSCENCLQILAFSNDNSIKQLSITNKNPEIFSEKNTPQLFAIDSFIFESQKLLLKKSTSNIKLPGLGTWSTKNDLILMLNMRNPSYFSSDVQSHLEGLLIETLDFSFIFPFPIHFKCLVLNDKPPTGSLPLTQTIRQIKKQNKSNEKIAKQATESSEVEPRKKRASVVIGNKPVLPRRAPKPIGEGKVSKKEGSKLLELKKIKELIENQIQDKREENKKLRNLQGKQEGSRDAQSEEEIEELSRNILQEEENYHQLVTDYSNLKLEISKIKNDCEKLKIDISILKEQKGDSENRGDSDSDEKWQLENEIKEKVSNLQENVNFFKEANNLLNETMQQIEESKQSCENMKNKYSNLLEKIKVTENTGKIENQGSGNSQLFNKNLCELFYYLSNFNHLLNEFLRNYLNPLILSEEFSPMFNVNPQNQATGGSGGDLNYLIQLKNEVDKVLKLNLIFFDSFHRYLMIYCDIKENNFFGKLIFNIINYFENFSDFSKIYSIFSPIFNSLLIKNKKFKKFIDEIQEYFKMKEFNYYLMIIPGFIPWLIYFIEFSIDLLPISNENVSFFRNSLRKLKLTQEAIFNEKNVSESVSGVDNRYKDLIEMLIFNNFQFIDCLLSSSFDFDAFILPLIHIYAGASLSSSFLKHLILIEISDCSDPSTLFRSNSFPSAYLSNFAHFHGDDYIQNVIKPFVLSIIHDPSLSFEVNPNTLGNYSPFPSPSPTRSFCLSFLPSSFPLSLINWPFPLSFLSLHPLSPSFLLFRCLFFISSPLFSFFVALALPSLYLSTFAPRLPFLCCFSKAADYHSNFPPP